MEASSDTNVFLRGSAYAAAPPIENEYYFQRSLQTDSNGNPLKENAPTRVGQIGVGTFVLILVVTIYIGICCFGSMMKRPGWLYVWSTIFTSTVIIFLFEAQRTDRYIQEEEVLSETDPYFNMRLFLLIFLIWTSIWTCCIWVYWYLSPSVQPQDVDIQSHESAFVKARPFL